MLDSDSKHSSSVSTRKLQSWIVPRSYKHYEECVEKWYLTDRDRCVSLSHFAIGYRSKFRLRFQIPDSGIKKFEPDMQVCLPHYPYCLGLSSCSMTHQLSQAKALWESKSQIAGLACQDTRYKGPVYRTARLNKNNNQSTHKFLQTRGHPLVRHIILKYI